MRAILMLAFVALFFVGYATSWTIKTLSYQPVRESPDYDFIRQWVEQSDNYKESMDPSIFSPWDIDELEVAYFDFNDDGVDEMVLSFTDVSSYYCGTGGCWVFFFEKRDGQWQVFHESWGADIYPTRDKILGYRTFFGSSGHRFQWDGSRYQYDCPEKPRSDMPPPVTRQCYE
jgi:hypothetical protein